MIERNQAKILLKDIHFHLMPKNPKRGKLLHDFALRFHRYEQLHGRLLTSDPFTFQVLTFLIVRKDFIENGSNKTHSSTTGVVCEHETGMRKH